MPDIAGNASTTTSITVDGVPVNDVLEVNGDHDWVRITLTAGQKVTILVDGVTLDDAYLRVRDSLGNQLAENDDISLGSVRDSRLVFTAPSSGTYYLDIGSFNDTGTGTYQLSVTTWAPPEVVPVSELAAFLSDGYWGGERHHFAATQGSTITVNITALTAPGQTLALEALALWADVTGINFQQVTSGGQITFDDGEEGAFSEATRSNGITTQAHVNVSTAWLTTNGTSLSSYSFQTYVHEIGHALGLGHLGYYNGDATYANDAEFANDVWSTSIMSYFDQQDNTYYSGLGFSRAFAVTPMVADIQAIASLYGLSTTTRTSDTTYGFGNNSGRAVFTAAVGNPITAYTIFDSGGIDTLNYSGFSSNQTINLGVETFSNVGGGIGNVSIAFGTIIENAVGGNGNDFLIGNNAANVLTGGSGFDSLTGGAGNDQFRDTTAGLNTDVITDFSVGDAIIFTNASMGAFSFTFSGQILTFTGGALSLTGGVSGTLVASAASGGGVQLMLQSVVAPIADARNDFNGDGRSDVMWRNDNGVFSVWHGVADGGFVASQLSDSTIPTSWRVVGSGDFNGDGRDDVLWRHNSGAFSQWLGMANGGFVTNSAADAMVGTDWQVAGTGDFDGDFYDDVVWRSDSGAFMVSFGQTNGSFVGNPLSNTNIATSWHIVGAGDFNGDSRDDILWRSDLGAFSTWSGQANGGFVSNPNSNTVVDASWHVAGTGDFNGDGREDVLWRNDSGAFSAWHGQADGGFVASPNSNTVVATSWQIAGTGDFNGDGRDDVLWRNDSGAFSAWHGQADGGFVASPNSNTVVANSWHVQSPDILIV